MSGWIIFALALVAYGVINQIGKHLSSIERKLDDLEGYVSDIQAHLNQKLGEDDFE